MACGDGLVVRQEQLTTGAADMGVEDRGQQRQDVGAAAPPFNLVLVDVPVEVIVDVAPPFHACPLRTERSGDGQ